MEADKHCDSTDSTSNSGGIIAVTSQSSPTSFVGVLSLSTDYHQHPPSSGSVVATIEQESSSSSQRSTEKNNCRGKKRTKKETAGTCLSSESFDFSRHYQQLFWALCRSRKNTNRTVKCAFCAVDKHIGVNSFLKHYRDHSNNRHSCIVCGVSFFAKCLGYVYTHLSLCLLPENVPIDRQQLKVDRNYLLERLIERVNKGTISGEQLIVLRALRNNLCCDIAKSSKIYYSTKTPNQFNRLVSTISSMGSSGNSNDSIDTHLSSRSTSVAVATTTPIATSTAATTIATTTTTAAAATVCFAGDFEMKLPTETVTKNPTGMSSSAASQFDNNETSDENIVSVVAATAAASATAAAEPSTTLSVSSERTLCSAITTSTTSATDLDDSSSNASLASTAALSPCSAATIEDLTSNVLASSSLLSSSSSSDSISISWESLDNINDSTRTLTRASSMPSSSSASTSTDNQREELVIGNDIDLVRLVDYSSNNTFADTIGRNIVQLNRRSKRTLFDSRDLDDASSSSLKKHKKDVVTGDTGNNSDGDLRHEDVSKRSERKNDVLGSLDDSRDSDDRIGRLTKRFDRDTYLEIVNPNDNGGSSELSVSSISRIFSSESSSSLSTAPASTPTAASTTASSATTIAIEVVHDGSSGENTADKDRCNHGSCSGGGFLHHRHHHHHDDDEQQQQTIDNGNFSTTTRYISDNDEDKHKNRDDQRCDVAFPDRSSASNRIVIVPRTNSTRKRYFFVSSEVVRHDQQRRLMIPSRAANLPTSDMNETQSRKTGGGIFRENETLVITYYEERRKTVPHGCRDRTVKTGQDERAMTAYNDDEPNNEYPCYYSDSENDSDYSDDYDAVNAIATASDNDSRRSHDNLSNDDAIFTSDNSVNLAIDETSSDGATRLQERFKLFRRKRLICRSCDYQMFNRDEHFVDKWPNNTIRGYNVLSNYRFDRSPLLKSFLSNDVFRATYDKVPDWLRDEVTVKHNMSLEELFDFERSGVSTKMSAMLFSSFLSTELVLRHVYLYEFNARESLEYLFDRPDDYYIFPFTCLCSDNCYGEITAQSTIDNILADLPPDDQDNNRDNQFVPSSLFRNVLLELQKHAWKAECRKQRSRAKKEEQQSKKSNEKQQPSHRSVQSVSTTTTIAGNNTTTITTAKSRKSSSISGGINVQKKRAHRSTKENNARVTLFETVLTYVQDKLDRQRVAGQAVNTINCHRHFLLCCRNKESWRAYTTKFCFRFINTDRMFTLIDDNESTARYREAYEYLRRNSFCTMYSNRLLNMSHVFNTVAYISRPSQPFQNVNVFPLIRDIMYLIRSWREAHENETCSEDAAYIEAMQEKKAKIAGYIAVKCLGVPRSNNNRLNRCGNDRNLQLLNRVGRLFVYEPNAFDPRMHTMERYRNYLCSTWSVKSWEGCHFYISKPLIEHGLLFYWLITPNCLTEQINLMFTTWNFKSKFDLLSELVFREAPDKFYTRLGYIYPYLFANYPINHRLPMSPFSRKIATIVRLPNTSVELKFLMPGDRAAEQLVDGDAHRGGGDDKLNRIVQTAFSPDERFLGNLFDYIVTLYPSTVNMLMKNCLSHGDSLVKRDDTAKQSSTTITPVAAAAAADKI